MIGSSPDEKDAAGAAVSRHTGAIRLVQVLLLVFVTALGCIFGYLWGSRSGRGSDSGGASATQAVLHAVHLPRGARLLEHGWEGQGNKVSFSTYDIPTARLTPNLVSPPAGFEGIVLSGIESRNPL